MRRRRDSEGTRAAVLGAAAREFAERSYEAGRVDRIAVRARVNKAMLYYHFGSKQGLYMEVLRDMFRAVGARTGEIVGRPDPADVKLNAWIRAIVEEAAARPWFPPIMLRELASGAAHIDDATLGMMNGIYVSVHEVIAQGQREGVFRDVDPLLTYLTILPSILIFFARARVVSRHKRVSGLAVASPRSVEDFIAHAQRSARAMLRSEA